MRTALVLLLSLPAFAEPRLLLNSADAARIGKLEWARDIVANLLKAADAWPEPHVREFGLSEWAIPREGSGWSHNYVCPEHGVRLTQKQGKNLCPIDGKDY